MTNLDHAISRFQNRAGDALSSEKSKDFAYLANALEEIRHFQVSVIASFDNIHKRIDVEIAEKQPIAEHTTFQPWHDVVEVIGETDHGTKDFIGVEGFIIAESFDASGILYEVRLSDETNTYYFPASSLRLVYRLKPRAQAEPPLPRRFESGDRVVTGTGVRGRVRWHIVEHDRYHILFDDGSEDAIPANELELDKPAPFKAGSYVKDIRDDVVYEVMQDGNGPTLQLRDIHTNQPAKCLINYLVKVEKQKPAPFQVGDWVEVNATQEQFQIAGINSDGVVYDQSRVYYCHISRLTKIDPPAPRFTFGQRVRWSDDPQVEGLITSDHGNGWYDVAFKDGTHPDPMDVIHGSKLTLDTAAT